MTTIHNLRDREILLKRIYKSAKANGYPCNLTIDDIIIPYRCRYSGHILLVDPKYKYHDDYATVDRINNNFGYIKNNIRIISQLANRMKNSATKEQQKTHAINTLLLEGETESAIDQLIDDLLVNDPSLAQKILENIKKKMGISR